MMLCLPLKTLLRSANGLDCVKEVHTTTGISDGGRVLYLAQIDYVPKSK